MNRKVFKISALAALTAAALMMVSCEGGSGKQGAAEPAKPAFDPNDEAHKTSYAYGSDIGKTIREAGVELDLDFVFMAIREAAGNQAPKLSDSTITAVNMRVQREINERRRQARRQEESDNLAASQAFLEQNKSAQGVVTTESGLQYIVMTEGKGAKPKATDKVKVHYHGTLPDGTVFDSSRDRGEPAQFAVTGVIKGWTEALQLMRVGSTYKIFVPPELAYGRRGTRGPIGPNMALVFEIELMEITK